MRLLAVALSFVCLSATADAKKEYELCLSKLANAEKHAEQMKQEYKSSCHYFYEQCSRPHWNGHYKPLVRDVTFVSPTQSHARANAKAVEIGNRCMVLLDEMEKAE